MRALADSYAFWVAIFAVLIVVYLLPTLIGMIRQVDQLALVFLVNLIGGPTGIGWLGALILAFGPRRPRPRTADASMARNDARRRRYPPICVEHEHKTPRRS
jgi:Superinfection immunity protein